MADTHDVNTPLLALIGFLGAILTFAIIVLLTVIYYSAAEHQEYVKNISQPYTELDNLLAAERAKLVEYRWVDQKSQTVAIPIERAMQLVVADYRSGKLPKAPNQSGTDAAETSSTTGAKGSTPGDAKPVVAPAGGRTP